MSNIFSNIKFETTANTYTKLSSEITFEEIDGVKHWSPAADRALLAIANVLSIDPIMNSSSYDTKDGKSTKWTLSEKVCSEILSAMAE